MRTHYDPVEDAFYVRFADAPVAESQAVAPGITLDFDASRRLVALEVLNARSTLAPGAVPGAVE
ncbi:conserved protein of unknown function [Rhodovastum atsumiense]|uniref:DUF2283 domain-containing protein n=1 Tax=Rhodovastum atsumiense TaxID=504468 RepID=A0A5M6IMJ0_9PROT|nr:DUF2283 domain-containing protein [Rhodovastum atsumiense]KAA5609481.1 DUF2283 domain-containing protein [Rhodovastum atsumiense]CAH2600823.1 conserved protein of unknown function [Rhodovastum atsumiense]